MQHPCDNLIRFVAQHEMEPVVVLLQLCIMLCCAISDVTAVMMVWLLDFNAAAADQYRGGRQECGARGQH